MTSQDDISIGEVIRSLHRLEASQLVITAALSQLGALGERVDNIESNVVELRGDMKAVRRDAAVVSGGTGMLAFLAALWWKH